MTLKGTIGNLFLELGVPWLVMVFIILHLPKTVIDIFKTKQYSTLISLSEFRFLWFKNFWGTLGPQVRRGYGPIVLALLQGRFAGGEIHDTVVSKPISGVVLEIGPGNGAWIDIFPEFMENKSVLNDATSKDAAEPGALTQEAITKVYGVEPNPFFGPLLRRRVADLSLSELYEVIPAGIEEVIEQSQWQEKISEGSVDCIVSVCCLCSIPNPEKNIKHLYRLLKPGGRWYIHEHVRAKRGGLLLRFYQCKLISHIHALCQVVKF